jgi:hypothetical protein
MGNGPVSRSGEGLKDSIELREVFLVWEIKVAFIYAR